MMPKVSRNPLGVATMLIALAIANRYSRNVALADGPCGGGCGMGASWTDGVYSSEDCTATNWCHYIGCSDTWSAYCDGWAPYFVIQCHVTYCK